MEHGNSQGRWRGFFALKLILFVFFPWVIVVFGESIGKFVLKPFFGSSEACRCQEWHVVSRAVLNCLCKAMRYDEAKEIFHSMAKRDTVSYNQKLGDIFTVYQGYIWDVYGLYIYIYVWDMYIYIYMIYIWDKYGIYTG